MNQSLIVRALWALATATLSLHCAISTAASPVRLSGAMVDNGNVSASAIRRARISANSQTVVFVSDRLTDGTFELWSVPITGGVPSRRSIAPPVGAFIDAIKLSPDGNWIAYTAAPSLSGRFELFVAPVTGASTPVNLSQLPAAITSGILQYEFTLNSTGVVFIADRADDALIKDELWVTSILGGTPTKLSGTTLSGGGITGFALTPNGSSVVFRGDRITNDRMELWSTPVGGGAISNVSGSATGTQSAGPYFQISPDNARVVFTGNYDASGANELYSAPLAGGSRIKISAGATAGYFVSPDFLITPDSQTVAFRADAPAAGAQIDLWRVSITGTSPVNLSNTAAGTIVSEQRITADGERAVFVLHVTGGTAELWTVPIAGGAAAVILPGRSGSTSSYSPMQLSPNGSRVVFAIDRETAFKRELWSVATTGGPISKLSPPMPANAIISSYLLSADGSRVVFTAPGQTPDRIEVWSNTIAGGSLTRLSGDVLHSDATAPVLAAISADSQYAVFTMDRAVSAFSELWASRIDGGGALLDVDGDGKVLPGTDLLILMRWQLGVRGNALFAGALGAGATRNTAALIEAYLQQVDVQAAP